jgi:putative redox protein
MVDIFMRYEGDLRCQARHAPSSAALATDAPADNQGKGGSFSPTDLVATALGTCMLTTMGMVARKRGWNIDGIEVQVSKQMTQQPPRKIERLPATFTVPKHVASVLDAGARRELEQTAKTCPVALSISDTIDVPISFDW